MTDEGSGPEAVVSLEYWIQVEHHNVKYDDFSLFFERDQTLKSMQLLLD